MKAKPIPPQHFAEAGRREPAKKLEMSSAELAQLTQQLQANFGQKLDKATLHNII